jgi:hypothetical protein
MWCAIALWTAHLGARASQAVLAAAFSSMTTMVGAVTVGLVLAVGGYPDPDYIATSQMSRASG